MTTITDARACRPSATRNRDADSFGLQERVALQEAIKFEIECLFGSVGGSWVYVQLGLADYLEERLGTAETVELVAVNEDVMTWNNITGPESSGDDKSAVSTNARRS